MNHLRASEIDAQTATLGYKQELRRNFSMIEVFGIAFSIMGLLPSIASTLTYSIPAGPAGMVWVSEAHRMILQNLKAQAHRVDISTGLVLSLRTDICCWVGDGIASAELLTDHPS